MAQVQQGDTVRVHYTGRLEDGTVFDTSENRDPLEFRVGEGKVIPGFESAVVGMEAGEKKAASIPSDEAYGPRREDLLFPVARGEMPEDLEPEEGQALQVQTGDGRTTTVRVADVSEEKVVLDANHPLAGEKLDFEIEVVEIR